VRVYQIIGPSTVHFRLCLKGGDSVGCIDRVMDKITELLQRLQSEVDGSSVAEVDIAEVSDGRRQILDSC